MREWLPEVDETVKVVSGQVHKGKVCRVVRLDLGGVYDFALVDPDAGSSRSRSRSRSRRRSTDGRHYVWLLLNDVAPLSAIDRLARLSD